MLETVKIKTAPCNGNPDGSVTINKSDFDPCRHQLFDKESFDKFSQEEKDAFEEQMDDEQARLEKEEADKKAEADRLAAEKDEADKLAAAAAKVEEKVEGKKSTRSK